MMNPQKIPQWILDDLTRSDLTPENFPVQTLKSRDELISRLGPSKIGEVAILKVSGYWIPYPNTEGFYRLKLGEPIDGRKYLSPRKEMGFGNHVYFPPGVLELAKDYKPDTPLFITEGEKKSAKATLDGFLCIGLPGVWNFTDKKTGFLSELESVRWKGRTVYVIYDSDIEGNRDVKQAELRLAVELQNRGARVLCVRLPNEPGGGKNGLDDFLKGYGSDALRKLVNDAGPVFQTQVSEGTSKDLILKEAARIDSEIDREKVHKLVATKEGVSLSSVRKEAQQYGPKVEVKEAAAGNGSTFQIDDPDPWADPVNGSDLLDAFTAKLHAHVRMGKHALTVCAVWALLTWVFDSFGILPMLRIRSPEKGCGKSTTLDVLNRFVARPLPASNITAAAIFRTVEVAKPTLLIDEVDTFVRDNEEIKGIINSGHKRSGAFVVRCVGQDSEAKYFSTWCPKVLCGIGHLKDTIEDRSIKIELTRLAPGEKVDRLRHSDQWPDLQQQAQRWANDNAEALRVDTTEAPDYLSNRLADNWSVLFVIAKAAGGEWVQKVDAAARHYAQFADDSNSIGGELLGDIKAVFEAAGEERLSTTDLLSRLISLEERPWGEWKQGKPMTARQLSARLKPFHVSSIKLRFESKTLNGFKVEQFRDIFNRYLSNTPILSGTPEQMNNDGDLHRNLSGTLSWGVPDKNTRNLPKSLEGAGVPDKNPTTGDKTGILPLGDIEDTEEDDPWEGTGEA